MTFSPATPTQIHRLTGQGVTFDYKAAVFPGYVAPMIVLGQEANQETALAIKPALFGLIPHWAKDRKFTKNTYNARSETVAEKPSYRTVWKARQFSLVPMERFYEPNWESGKAEKWSIHRKDGELFAVAGIWSNWTDHSTGEIVGTFSLLTINADGHPVMGRFHRPGDEKRSLVIVDSGNWNQWLRGTTDEARALLLPMNEREFSAANVSAS